MMDSATYKRDSEAFLSRFLSSTTALLHEQLSSQRVLKPRKELWSSCKSCPQQLSMCMAMMRTPIPSPQSHTSWVLQHPSSAQPTSRELWRRLRLEYQGASRSTPTRGQDGEWSELWHWTLARYQLFRAIRATSLQRSISSTLGC